MHSIVKPTHEENQQHYLWRFWNKLPPYGQTTIFDRSHYGRVLVERVEGFARVEFAVHFLNKRWLPNPKL